MFAATLSEVQSRLAEVRQLLDAIKGLESAPPVPDSSEVRVMRGLFFVHLYAGLEYAVNAGVENLLQQIAGTRPELQHYEQGLLTIVLEPQFMALRNVGEERRWAARLALIDKLFSSDKPKVGQGIFGLYLQNIWAKNLHELFRCLHIPDPVSPDPAYLPYLDEVTNKRNGVAHGRFSALGLGGSMRSNELEIRLKAVSEIALHAVRCFEKHALDVAYVVQPHRATYRQP